MMTLFSTLMPLISAAASFSLARCRFGASFMRAPVELVEIAIHHPSLFFCQSFFCHFSFRTATIGISNRQLVCRALLRESTTKKRRARRLFLSFLRVLRFFVVDFHSF